ncbi:MAG: restriction endonuclease subunit S [Desulfobacteraceae bacterium]|nr:restriction endonuclease subunit S [Desulfobacteraceae bacterium]
MSDQELVARCCLPQDNESVSGEVPPGYKRTEAGVIPVDWEVKSLGEIAEIVSGGTPSTQVDEYWNGDIPWCTPTDITSKPGKYLIETQRNITHKGLSACSARLLPPGSVLLCSRATIGDVKIAKKGVCTNQGFKSLICSNDVSNEFVYYLLVKLKDQLVEKASGSTFLEVSRRDVENLRINLPPAEEQHAISTALSDADALINSLDRFIAKKLAIKQATMQQLLTGQTRLSGFKGEWQEKRLGDIISCIVGGGTPSRANPAYWGDGIPWVTVKDFADFDPEATQESITLEGLKNSASNRIPAGTIILSTRMAVGQVAIYRVDVAINQDLKAIFLNNFVVPEYVFHWFRFSVEKLEELGSGSTVKGLSLSDLKSIKFMVPHIDEQSAIASVLSDMDAEIEVLERRREKAKQIKQGMMQQLLTGRVRLIDLQPVVDRPEAEFEASKSHRWAFDEAVLIATLVKHFGNAQFPMGRKRYTKFSYLFHRCTGKQPDGYLKKAAGPYNPKTKYGGPEKIAIEKDFIREHKSGRYSGFVAGDNISQAESYFKKWYGSEIIQWLDQFRFMKTDELELLTTVDMAVCELEEEGKPVNIVKVKDLIRSHTEWEAKLGRSIFSEECIASAIEKSIDLFSGENSP